MKRGVTLIGLLIVLGGCRPEPDTTMEVPVRVESRIKIERIGVFEDNLAYNDRRGIYLIRDTATGKEYIGVSGIGISELGQHSAGKSNLSDER